MAAPVKGSRLILGDVTWNFASFNTVPWNTPGGGGDFVTTESADTFVSQNLNTAYIWGSTPQMVANVQGWLDGSLPNFGWLLKNDSEADPTTFRAFYTAEGAIEQNVPQFAPELAVSFVVPTPEPSSFGLLALPHFPSFRSGDAAAGECSTGSHQRCNPKRSAKS